MSTQNRPSNQVVNQVFLSPRVLDQTAFEEFAGTLRGLIERADRDAAALQTALSQAEALQKKLAEAAPVLESRLAAAAGALAGIDARAGEASGLFTKAAAHAAAVTQAEARIEELAETRLARFEAGVKACEEAAQRRVEALKLQTDSILLGAQTALEQALRRAHERAAEMDKAISVKLANLVDVAQSDVAALEARVAQISGRLANMAGPGIAGLAALCDRAVAVLGHEPGTNPAGAAAGSLTDIADRAERLRDEADDLMRHLKAAATEAEAARSALTHAVSETAQLAGDLSHRHTAIRSDAQQAVAQCAAATNELLAKAQEFQGWTSLLPMIEVKPTRRAKPSKAAKPAARSAKPKKATKAR